MLLANDVRHSPRSLANRRTSRRFPIVTDLEYRMTGPCKEPLWGTGRTVNVSSKGVLLESSSPLPVGRSIQLAIVWPILLNEETGLKLWVTGRTVRTDGHRTAVAFHRHEMRTRRLSTAAMPESPEERPVRVMAAGAGAG